MSNVKEFYLKGLSNEDKNKHKKYIINRRKSAREGKYLTKKPELKSYKHRKSQKVLEFERKYGIKITNKKAIEKEVGLPISAQKEIIDKGKGAFFSDGSRPGQTPQSWAYGRLASVILKKGAYKFDKHILDKYDVKIKKPVKKTKKPVKKTKKPVKKNKKPVKKTKKPVKIKTRKLMKVKDCLSENLTKKDKKCRRNSDGKIFKLPRRFSRERCLKGVSGYSMRSSCAPYKK
tara:strand:+ start:112 stop:807 length:696 start_codon:yes stop_codon:yes gene_type:complete